MRYPDADTEARRLIAQAAARFGGPDSDVGELPYDDAGFDDAYRSMSGHLRRTLDGGLGEFVNQVLDEAATVYESVTARGGGEWHVEARLFAMMASGLQPEVAALATPEGLASVASAISGAGLASRGAVLAFVGFPLPLSVVGEMSPGRLRQVTRCLSSGAVRGLPAAPHAGPLDVLGVCEASFGDVQYAAKAGTVTRAIVGVRCVRARSDRRMARDWFSAFDPSDAPGDAQAAWERAMAGGVEVGMPMSWMDVAGLLAADHVVGALSAEATDLGLDLRLGQGTVHFHEEGTTMAVALETPGGRVLGPARTTRDAMLGGLDVLSSVLGEPGRTVHRHVGPASFNRLVMTGASPCAGADDADGDMPAIGLPPPGDGMPAVH